MDKETLDRKKGLLKALQQDVLAFGPAGDDVSRIAALQREIKEAESVL